MTIFIIGCILFKVFGERNNLFLSISLLAFLIAMLNVWVIECYSTQHELYISKAKYNSEYQFTHKLKRGYYILIDGEVEFVSLDSTVYVTNLDKPKVTYTLRNINNLKYKRRNRN